MAYAVIFKVGEESRGVGQEAVELLLHVAVGIRVGIDKRLPFSRTSPVKFRENRI